MRRILGSRWTIALLASLVTAGVVGGVSYAVADAPGGTSTFYACSSSNGVVRAQTIRVNQPPASCPAGSAVTSWNATGPTGAQGPVGQASVVSLVPAASVTCPTPPPPSPDPSAGSGAFLSVDNVKGESTDQQHSGQIDVLSWSWGAAGAGHASCGTARGATGGGTGSTFNSLTVVTHVDMSTPILEGAVAAGTHLGTAVLSVAKQGVDYLVITLENTIVSSFEFVGANGGDPIPRAQFTLDATKVTLQYTQVHADGTTAPPILSCFDVSIQLAC